MPATILYLNPSGHLGGGERSLLVLLAALDRTQFEPRVILTADGPLRSHLGGLGIATEIVLFPPAMLRFSRSHRNAGRLPWLRPATQLPEFGRQLLATARAMQPALIHSNGLKMHLLASWVLRGLQVPVLWHIQDFPPGGLAERLLRWTSGQPAQVVCDSRAVESAWRIHFPRLQHRLQTIHNGVAPGAFRRGDGPAFRAAHGLPTEALVVGMCSVFAPWKGHEVLLRAAQTACAARPELHVLVVGDDIYDTIGHGNRRRELEALARSLGLAARVHFVGFIDAELADAYAAMDIAVHAATRPEPFGMVVVEAMAGGVPVIASAAGGIPEIVTSPEQGLLVAPGDSGQLATAILRLAADSELRHRMAQRGQERVREAFSARRQADAFTALYAQLLRPPSASLARHGEAL